MATSSEAVLDLVRRRGQIRARDLEPLGLHRTTLARLVRQEELVRVGRGLYALPNPAGSVSEYSTFAEVARRYPKAVICLLSALRFHDLTTQSPFEVWIGISNKARLPKLDYPPLRVVRFSASALENAVEEHKIDGVPVRITTIAKTVVDCFKYRNKIGLDVALEALREAWSEQRVSMDELWRCATVYRASNVMRPYLESLV